MTDLNHVFVAEMRSFPEDRAFVVRGSLAGVVFTFAFGVLGYFLFPVTIPQTDSILTRLVYTIRWQMLPAFSLLTGVLCVMYKRFQSSAINPVLGRSEHIIEIHQRYIRNTTEQLVLHVIGQLVLCTYLTSQTLVVIPVCSLLFVIGRMTFWVGYIREPLKRMFGFMITFSMTSGCLLYSFFCFLMSGPTFALHE